MRKLYLRRTTGGQGTEPLCCVVADTLPQLQKELRMRITGRAIALESELLHFVAVTRIDLKEV